LIKSVSVVTCLSGGQNRHCLYASGHFGVYESSSAIALPVYQSWVSKGWI